MSGQAKGHEQDTFAVRLKRIQRELLTTNEALSRATGISVRLINKYRSGVTEPRDSFGEPSENAYKIAAALGEDVADLLPEPEDVAA